MIARPSLKSGKRRKPLGLGDTRTTLMRGHFPGTLEGGTEGLSYPEIRLLSSALE